MLAYMHYLSVGYEVGSKVKGTVVKPEFIDRAADPKKGAKIYADRCASCHGENGEGVINEEFAKGRDFDVLVILGAGNLDNYTEQLAEIIKEKE